MVCVRVVAFVKGILFQLEREYQKLLHFTTLTVLLENETYK